MQDSEIIWKFLSKEYKEDHPVIFIYCRGHETGQLKSKENAIVKVTKLCQAIFGDSMSESLVKTVVLGYLDHMKKEYKFGRIKIKSLY
jgi:hypothetical protein